MIVNSAWATSATPAFRLCRLVKPATLPAIQPPPSFPMSVKATASATIQPTSRMAVRSIERPKTKKKSAAKMARKVEEPLLDLLADGRLGQDDSRHQRSDGLREAQLVGHRRGADEEPEHGEQEELERETVERTVERACKPPRRRQADRDEPERLGDEDERVGRLAPAGRGEAKQEGDNEVLEDEDREHEVGLVVAEPTKVGQPLGRDRARRHVHTTGKDDRRKADAEGRDPHDQTEAEVGGEVDDPAQAGMAPRRPESREAELESEKEEEEDDSELRHELGDLGRADQHDLPRLVRAQQDPRGQIRRDRGEAETAHGESEHAEDRDRDGELGEGHTGILPFRRRERALGPGGPKAPKSGRL